MKNPYFSFDGMAFKTPGDHQEFMMNIEIAMQHLRKWVLSEKGASESDAADALTFLEDNCPKVGIYCDQMRDAFKLDDFIDSERKKAIIRRTYNRMADRLST